MKKKPIIQRMAESLFHRIGGTGLLMLQPRLICLESLSELIDFALATELVSQVADERVSLIIHQRPWMSPQRLKHGVTA